MSGGAIASLIVAGLALVWTVYRDLANRRSLARERNERLEADVREEERRNEEIALLRRQVAHAEDREREERRARLVARAGGWSGSGQGVDQYVFIRNIGGAAAENVLVWLVLDETAAGIEPTTSRPLTQKHPFAVVAPNDPEQQFSLTQSAPFPGGRVERGGIVIASWTDELGEHVERIGSAPAFV